jgi:hypothetical protein
MNQDFYANYQLSEELIMNTAGGSLHRRPNCSPDEQEALAALLLDEIASERLWDQAFAQSQNQIAKLADEAVTEFQEGRTVLLDEEQL